MQEKEIPSLQFKIESLEEKLKRGDKTKEDNPYDEDDEIEKLMSLQENKKPRKPETPKLIPLK